MENFFWECTLPTFIVAAGLIVCGFFVARPFVAEIFGVHDD